MTAITLPRRDARARSTFAIDGRALRLLASCAGVAAAGGWMNGQLDWPLLRVHVALACAALASTLVLVDRWAAEPQRIARGGLLAALAGTVAAWLSLH